ncbi:hypothetical protein ACPYO6_07560 [Georgenia sp. Z1344]|uniref:hypothetical protein n=1 Tax=Georgenia sp. Z1344 TaxID=3416706 RepID=UPI003CF14216
MTPPDAPRSRWTTVPYTIGIVVLGCALVLWPVVVQGLSAASIYQDPPRGSQIVSWAALRFSALAAVLALVLLGLTLGSRWGLLLLALPALYTARRGADLVQDAPRTIREPETFAFMDLFTPYTTYNWTVVALSVLGASVLLAHRARRARRGGLAP